MYVFVAADAGHCAGVGQQPFTGAGGSGKVGIRRCWSHAKLLGEIQRIETVPFLGNLAFIVKADHHILYKDNRLACRGNGAAHRVFEWVFKRPPPN